MVYGNAALQRLAGRRAGRNATLEELLAGEPGGAQAFFRLNRAAERGEVCDEELYVRPQGVGGPGGRWLRIGVRAIAAPGSDASARSLTLWQVTDISRERKREIETVAAWKPRSPSTTTFRKACWRGADAASPNQRDAGAVAGPDGVGPRADAARFVSADGRGADPRRGRGGEPAHPRLELDLLARGRPGISSPAHLPQPRRARHDLRARLERSVDLPHQGKRAESRRAVAALHAAPVGIATSDRDGRIVTTNAAFTRMFSIEDRAAPAGVRDLVPPGQEEAGRALARAIERAVSGRAGAAPVEVSFGPKNELARRIYVSPLGVGKRGREGAIVYAIDATEQKALELNSPRATRWRP